MTSTMVSREHAESAACAWIARRERDDWSERDQPELDAWIAADMANRVAWLRANAAWQQTSRLKSLTTSAPPGTVPGRDDVQLPFFDSAVSTDGDRADLPALSSRARLHRPSFARHRALAASVLLAMAVAAVWYVVPRGQAYRTDIGALQAVPLADGSRVTLNTNTAIRVEVTQTERRVDLGKGEAYFEVAKDPSRPFIVQAGDHRVIAVGTQFSVRREQSEVRVLVTEGKVRIERDERGETSPPQPTQLDAGTVARAGGEGVLVQQKPVAEVEQLLSWRSGYLAFDKTPLADAVAEFNRYNKRQVVIADPAVAAIRIGGNFRATNVEGFVRLIQSDLPITSHMQGNEITLTAASHTGN